MRQLRLAACASGLIAMLAGAAAEAHEFWIDPVLPLPAAGGDIVTDLRVGENFKGDVYPYVSRGFYAFRLAVRGRSFDISGNEGDIPAIAIGQAPEGLNVISFYGRPNKVVFTDPALFSSYLTAEGLDWVAEAHTARSLPPSGFTEAFSRNVKTLVQSGPITSEDADLVVGMPLELVAGANPYADPDLQALPVTLRWEGRPLANTQIAIFQDTGTVTRTILRTDQAGQATIPLRNGGRFLLNAVHMRQAPPELEAAWESHWASLTFALPVR